MTYEKKPTILVLAFAVCFLAAITLAGCSGAKDGGTSGGANDKVTDCTWFKIEVPDGVKASDQRGTTVDKMSFEFEYGVYFKPIWEKGETAQALLDEQKSRHTNGWVDEGEMKLGNNTFLKGNYEHGRDSRSDYYFMDADGGAVYFLVDYKADYEEQVKTMLSTFELADNVDEKIKEAKNINISDVKIK